MNIILVLFWLSLAILFYCYFGYGIIAVVITFARRLFYPKKKSESRGLLPLSLVVTAYKEGDILQNKIDNILDLDYPREMLKVIFVIDEPEPSTLALFGNYDFIHLIQHPLRRGKYAAIKKAMEIVDTPVVVFSDANSILNKDALKKMVAHYEDIKVGAVAGEKKILYQQQHSALGQAEGWYWEYESFMKRIDAGLYTVVGAAGELFSIRADLFLPSQDDILLDDLVISMQVCMQGYKIAYEPGAFAAELPSVSLPEEEKRKVRIAAGAFQSLGILKDLLHPFRHPVLFFQFISRRFFRWILSPLSLMILFISNIFLVTGAGNQYPFEWFLYLQLSFYTLALLGYLLIRSGRSAGICNVPFYFLFMNYCLVKGFSRFLSGRQTVKWDKVARQIV